MIPGGVPVVNWPYCIVVCKPQQLVDESEGMACVLFGAVGQPLHKPSDGGTLKVPFNVSKDDLISWSTKAMNP